MNLLGIIGLALAQTNTFFDDRKLNVELSDRAKEMAAKNMYENPVYLDAKKNGLYLNKILSTFTNPNFTGVAPPGITTFMTNQVLLSGERRDGYVYPLHLKNVVEVFDEKNRKLVIEDNCSKSGQKGCPEGYKKIIVNPDAPEKEKTGEEAPKPAERVVSVPSNVVEPTSQSGSA